MTATYNWIITKTDYIIADGFVKTAHWTCNAVDGDYTASIYSTCSWADGTPTVPYADLTQETVLGWVWANGVSKEATEAAVEAQLQAQINPPVVTPALPWSAA